MERRDSSWNRPEFTILGKFCPSQMLFENYRRFAVVLFQAEYGTRKWKCWEFPEKSHSTELTSSKRLKKPPAVALQQQRKDSGAFFLFTTHFQEVLAGVPLLNSQFAPCQQQPGPPAQNLGPGISPALIPQQFSTLSVAPAALRL